MSELAVLEAMRYEHPDVIRGFIDALELTCLNVEGKIDIPVEHHFAGGVYAREMKMPKGALVVGKIHRFENLSVLLEGEASVLSSQGLMRIKAPFTLIAPPGTKRAIFAHSDLTWTVFHATKSKDLAKIEDEMIAKDYESLGPDWSYGRKQIKDGES